MTSAALGRSSHWKDVIFPSRLADMNDEDQQSSIEPPDNYWDTVLGHWIFYQAAGYLVQVLLGLRSAGLIQKLNRT
jgi:hypothetical protein